MKQNLYVFSNTMLKREQNTLLFQKIEKEEKDEPLEDEVNFCSEEFLSNSENIIPTGDKKYIPIETINSIFAVGTISFNSRFLYFLSQNNIPLHFFSKNNSYAGSFLPQTDNCSGNLIVNQVEYYSNFEKRLFLAKKMVIASLKSIVNNLHYYSYKGGNFAESIERIEENIFNISLAESVQEIMGFEGDSRHVYYRAWQNIFVYPTNFFKRVKNPPNNMINLLISYGNMIVYGTVLNEIRKTKIYPEIGFVHEVGDLKLPLVYDLADIFKPIIVDRTIFKVINHKMINERQFFTKNNFCRINKKAKQTFTEIIDQKLFTPQKVEGYNNKICFVNVIKDECYKLIKQFNEDIEYEPFTED
jgi:CRISPR-associated protein Cas1